MGTVRETRSQVESILRQHQLKGYTVVNLNEDTVRIYRGRLSLDITLEPRSQQFTVTVHKISKRGSVRSKTISGVPSLALEEFLMTDERVKMAK